MLVRLGSYKPMTFRSWGVDQLNKRVYLLAQRILDIYYKSLYYVPYNEPFVEQQ